MKTLLQHQRIKVLVVDDHKDSVTVLCMLLNMLGYDAHGANEPEDVLRIAREVLPQVVLMDIGMPRMNGFEIATAMKKDPLFDQVRLVAFTGHAGKQVRKKALRTGFDVHLVKPAKREELIAAIEG